MHRVGSWGGSSRRRGLVMAALCPERCLVDRDAHAVPVGRAVAEREPDADDAADDGVSGRGVVVAAVVGVVAAGGDEEGGAGRHGPATGAMRRASAQGEVAARAEVLADERAGAIQLLAAELVAI